ncbi:MAG: hypothetical protein NWF00_11315 [Candidatus Bathyarchaeota archaeon]|nr:hypothetical protein [Candidatus Bathyarchaeota archaeon]
MKILLSKKKMAFLSLMLLVTLALPLMSFSLVNAHDPPWIIQTYAFITASPNPAQVDNPLVLVFWVDIPPPTAVAATGDRWQGFSVNVTRPDGTVDQVITDGVSDPVGSSYAVYVPEMTGTFTAEFSWPGQTLERAGYTGVNGSDSAYIGDFFEGGSANTTFTVTTDPPNYYQEAPLPVSYWTRPIDANNQNWAVIASAWLGQNEFGTTYLKYNPYGWAPNTAHVMWTMPISFGGVVGGDHTISDEMTFYSGTQYQLKFNNPIIMYGRVYFSLPLANSPTGLGVTCVNLRTGVTEWTRTDLASVNIGQFYDFESPNQHGVNPNGYLWVTGFAGTPITGTGIVNGNDTVSETNATAQVSATGWMAIDPLSGVNIFNETNVPSGTRAYGPLGEWLLYNIGGQNGSSSYLWQWNNTKIPGIDNPSAVTQWLPGTTNQNMSEAYDWNVTLSETLTPKSSPIGGSGFGVVSTFDPATGLYTTNPTLLRVFPGNVIFGQSSGLQQTPGTSAGIIGTPDPFTLWAINLNASRGEIGEVLWVKDYPAPPGNITINIGPADGETNVFTLYYKQTVQWLGYDLLTGEQLWGPTPMETPAWNYYTGSTALTNPIGMGYGHLYVAGYGGVLRAYNLTTGNLTFTWGNDPNDPTNSTITPNTVYGDYPTQVAAIVDGKVYLVQEEHSLGAPPYQGAMTHCVDAFTGELKWQIYGMSSWQMQAVADGYYTWLNLNDMRVYCMGPGPSSTTVQATPIGTSGDILIQGKVLDESPALKGTPAIADDDQGLWMEYMIQSTIEKPEVQGVPVQLTAVDSDGNTHDVGQVTSDSEGLFSFVWTPPIAGALKIMANFEGTQSYGPSSAATAVSVATGTSTTATPTPTATEPATPTSTSATGSPTATETQTASPSPVSPPSGGPAVEIYVIIAAVVIIIVVALIAVFLRRRS